MGTMLPHELLLLFHVFCVLYASGQRTKLSTAQRLPKKFRSREPYHPEFSLDLHQNFRSVKHRRGETPGRFLRRSLNIADADANAHPESTMIDCGSWQVQIDTKLRVKGHKSWQILDASFTTIANHLRQLSKRPINVSYAYHPECIDSELLRLHTRKKRRSRRRRLSRETTPSKILEKLHLRPPPLRTESKGPPSKRTNLDTKVSAGRAVHNTEDVYNIIRKPYRSRSPHFLPLFRKNVRKDLIVAKVHSGDVKISHAKLVELKEITKKTSKSEDNRGGIEINVHQRPTKEVLKRKSNTSAAQPVQSQLMAVTTPRSAPTTTTSKTFVIDQVLQLITSKYTFDASDLEVENSQPPNGGTDSTARKTRTSNIMKGSEARPEVAGEAKRNRTTEAAKQVADNLTNLDSAPTFKGVILQKKASQTKVPPHIRNELARAAKRAASQKPAENTEMRENSGELPDAHITFEVIQLPTEEASPNLEEMLKRRKSRQISKRSGNVRAA